MVGGPVFGPQPRFKRALFVAVFVVALVALAAGPSALVGCAPPPKIEYRPLPDALILPAPAVPTVPADDLKCLSEAAYLRLANRDRLLRRHIAELRALLGADHAESR